MEVDKRKRRRRAPALFTLKNTLEHEKGSNVTELAILLPVLLMILMAIFAFGNAYSRYLGVQHAASEGARLAAVGNFNSGVVAKRALPATPDSIAVNYPNGNKHGESVEVTVIDEVKVEIPFYGSYDVPLKSTVVTRIES